MNWDRCARGYSAQPFFINRIAPLTGRGCFQKCDPLGKLGITLGLIETDQGQRRDHFGSRLLGGHLASCAAGHSSAPIGADHRHGSCTAGHAAET